MLRIGRLGLVLLAVLLLAVPGRFASAGDLAMVQGAQSLAVALPGAAGPEPLSDPAPALVPPIPARVRLQRRAQGLPARAPQRRVAPSCRRPPSRAPPCPPQS